MAVQQRDVVVIGAGPAGLSTALALKDAGVGALVLDRAAEVASSWRGRYDRLKLNSPKRLSSLPGRPYPKDAPTFPGRDAVVAYLERHAREGGVDLQLATSVARIEPGDPGGWALETGAGPIAARQVVVATGHEHTPSIPDWRGREGFTGTLLHSSAYRNPEPFQGRSVLVVGAGCSGMEIAYDLAEGGAGPVWLSARTPPNIVLRTGPGGLPGEYIALALMRAPLRVADWLANVGRRMDVGDLSEYGLPIPAEGVMSRLRRTGLAPAILDKEVIEAVTARRFTVVPGVEAIDGDRVVLAGGDAVQPDVIISATGFARGLEPLAGHLGVLDDAGEPRVRGGEPAAPGLRFVGYTPRPAMIGHSAKEARRAARGIVAELAATAAR